MTRRLMLSGLALIAVCYGLARFAYGLFVPAIRTEFALSDAVLGVIGAGSYVGYCLGALMSAPAVSRFGPRTVAISAGTIAAAGMTIVALSPNGALLAAGILIAGSSTGVASPPLAAAVTRWVPENGQDRAQAIINTGTGAGIVVSVPVALLATGHWRAAWIAFALVAAAVTCWIATVLPVTRPRKDSSGLSLPTGAFRLITAAALFGASSSAIWTFGRDHVATAGGLGERDSMLFWLVVGVGELTGLAGGSMVARYGVRHLWMGAISALAVATLALWARPDLLAYPAAFLFGAAYLLLTTLVLLWAIRLQPQHTAGAVALGFVMIAAGQAIGSPLAGLLNDLAGAGTAFLAFAALGFIGATLAPSRQPYSTPPLSPSPC